MKSLFKGLILAWLMGACSVSYAVNCTGKFTNPITDFCWSCFLPIKISGAAIMTMGQEDNNSQAPAPVCFCPDPLGAAQMGLSVSFWEPIRTVDVTTKPFCMVALGGTEISVGGLGRGAGAVNLQDSKSKSSTYHVHWYVNPILYVLESILDNNCLERSVYDISILTEIDPLWQDDELTSIINPDIYLFANLVAQASCAVDCVAATTGFGNNLMHWCAGCQGSMFPLTGNISAHTGGVQASVLMAERMTFKLHREGILWAGHAKSSDTSAGLCGLYPEIQMDKTFYKYHMLFPIPADDTSKNGKCCQPFGRSTTVFESGKEIPYTGEDFAYQIIRKRDCCQGIPFN